ncbi:SPX domain-containing membrane protein [Capsicum chinense]|nr:SPX domain-containing membrane protein [Capsicum chinense]
MLHHVECLSSECMLHIEYLPSEYDYKFIPSAVTQYVCSGLLMFVSAEVLEGVNLSLLSRVMSSRLSRGTYNGGLLSTEAGTIARVIADVTITLAGYLGQSRLLNVTLLPSRPFLLHVVPTIHFTDARNHSLRKFLDMPPMGF